MRISFRPHHFLCTLGFQGKGYSPAFVKNYEVIVKTLQDNEDCPIDVVFSGDSICYPCPHHTEKGCQKEEKIQRLDTQHTQILDIKPGDILTWREAKGRLKEHMTLGAFHQACQGCSWKSLGFCEKALKNLREGKVHDDKAAA